MSTSAAGFSWSRDDFLVLGIHVGCYWTWPPNDRDWNALGRSRRHYYVWRPCALFSPPWGDRKGKKIANFIHTGPEPGPGGRGVRAIDWIGAICISRLGMYLSRRAHTHTHTRTYRSEAGCLCSLLWSTGGDGIYREPVVDGELEVGRLRVSMYADIDGGVIDRMDL